MKRKLHELVQGSPEWHQFRLDHFGASEAAPMLGLSRKVTRSELLRMKHTGVAKEFSDFVQTKILDYGHEVEALARPLVEDMIADELYPATYSLGKLSASVDGLTMDGETAFEHKQWNAELAASVTRGELPEEHQPQCQQIILVTGALRVIFVVSDGTRENFVHMEVKPDAKWSERIQAGWAQFEIDLANYRPPEVIPAVVAAPVLALPAVSIKVDGAIALISNLPDFGKALKEFIAKIPAKPSTDQEFVDCKAACKALQEAQDALDAGEASALGQIATFDEMRRTKALYWELARTTRLAVEKLVSQREQQIKVEIVQKAKTLYEEHIKSLQEETGGPWICLSPPDFAGAIKGKRTIASLQNAVDTALANGKIAADASAKLIRANLACLKADGKGFEFLFNDSLALISKPIDDLRLLIRSRISDHKAEHARKVAAQLEAEREKIRAEEAAKLQKIEQDRLEAARIQQEGIERAARAKETAAAQKEMLHAGSLTRPEAPVGGQHETVTSAPHAAQNSSAAPPPPLAPPSDSAVGGTFNLLAHLYRQIEFSARTFGPGERTAGVVDHIRKELIEIEADPTDLLEWIDVVILAFDGAWRAGYSPEDIITALVAKQTRNESRKWPDWRTAAPGKAIQHIKAA